MELEHIDSVPNLYTEWDFEADFDGDVYKMAAEKGNLIPLMSSIVYLTLIYYGKAYMKDRQKFDLRNLLFTWSFTLAIVSSIAVVRIINGCYNLYVEHGIISILCTGNTNDVPILRFWAVFVLLTKFLEFGDTAFIVLRKQPLSFLHSYHHITVLGYCWISYGGGYAGQLVFITINLIVHSCMYSYYAARAWAFKPPVFVKKMITSLQIAQMIVGFNAVIAIANRAHPKTCPTSTFHLTYGLLMYFSYLVLFCHFFYHAYLKIPKLATKKHGLANEHLQDAGESPNVQPIEDQPGLRKRGN